MSMSKAGLGSYADWVRVCMTHACASRSEKEQADEGMRFSNRARR